MSPESVGLVGVLVLLTLLTLRMPVGLCLALVGFLGSACLGSWSASFSFLGLAAYKTATNYGLIVIPLFILMGQTTKHAGIGAEIYQAFYRWLGFLPGGLGVATIASCAGFSAVSGSSLATTATMGMVALPEMKKFHYDDSFATGCLAAGGSLGILFPPSTVMIIYCVLTGQAIGPVFIAGIVPGLLLTALFIVVIFIISKKRPADCPSGRQFSLAEKVLALKNIWGIFGLVGLVLGGLYGGWFTPTEAAAMASSGALLVAFAKGRFSWELFQKVLSETTLVSGAIFLVLIGANVFGYFLTLTQLPEQLASWATSTSANPHLILLALICVYIVLGCFLEGMAIMVLTLPVVFPIVMGLGFDPIWFGIIIVLVMEMSLVTPPLGMNVIMINGIAADVPLGKIYRGVLPFWLAMVVCILFLTLFPEIALFLTR